MELEPHDKTVKKLVVIAAMLIMAAVSVLTQRNYTKLTDSVIPTSCSSYRYYQTASLHTGNGVRVGDQLPNRLLSVLEAIHGSDYTRPPRKWTLIYVTNPSQRYYVAQMQSLKGLVQSMGDDEKDVSVIIVIKSQILHSSLAYLADMYNRELGVVTILDEANFFGELPATPYIGSYLIDSSGVVVFDSETLLPCAIRDVVAGFLNAASTKPRNDSANDTGGKRNGTH